MNGERVSMIHSFFVNVISVRSLCIYILYDVYIASAVGKYYKESYTYFILLYAFHCRSDKETLS